MFTLLLRNMILYFKDKAVVALSFLAEAIIIALYFLFLRKNLIDDYTFVKNSDLLMDSWMLGGILGITSVTTTMGAYGIMVDDRIKKIRRDFLTSPLRKSSLIGGYMLSAIFIGLVMSFLTLIASEIYLYYRYDIRLEQSSIIYVYLEIMLATISNSSIVLLLVSFLKSSNALAACCTILGSLIGFITGIYLPIGSLPKYVKWIVEYFPVSHSVSLIRKSILDPMIVDSFGSKTNSGAKTFVDFLGIGFADTKTSVLILVSTTVICAAGAVLNLSFSLSSRNGS